MPTNAIKKQLHLYFGSNGTLLDRQGDLSANAQDDETFVINAYIEDGVVDNQTTLINFTPQDTMAYTSDWFAMFYRELVSYVVPTESEPRVFAKFSITVPSIILLVKSGKEQFTQRITIIQRYGNTHLGNFETLAQLNVDFPPTQALDENNDVAFVYSNEVGQSNQVGFYQVEYIEGNHVWVKKDTILYNLATKQFNFLGLTVNVGFSNPRGVPTVAQSTIYQLMQELNSQAVRLQIVEDGFEMMKPRLEQNDIENALIKQTDWNYESYLSEENEFANSRNGWCQVGNEVYVFGGLGYLGTNANPKWSAQKSNKIYKYNLTTREWTFLMDMPVFANESRCAYKNGFIYLYNSSQTQTLTSPQDLTNKFHRYEIATNNFTTLPNPPINILFISSLIELNNKIYIVVDSTFNGSQIVMNSQMYIYDIVSETWSEGSQTNTSFDRGNAVYYNGLIYVQRSLKFQAYNPTTDTWITNLTPPTYGVVHTGLMHVYKDRLFIGSGWQSSVAQNNPFIQYYDVKKDKWYVATRIELNYEPLGYGTLALFDNSLYYLGGYVNELNPVFNRYVMSFNLERLDLDNVVNLQDQVDDIVNGTTTVKKAEQDKNGNDIVNTYETKVIVSGIDNRVTSLENANMVKSVSYAPLTHVITFTFYDNTTQSLDLPLESAIIGASYDNVTKDITFTLQNGSTLVVPLDDLVSGLASETWVTQKINNIDYVPIQNQDIQQKQKMKLYIVNNQIGYDIEEE